MNAPDFLAHLRRDHAGRPVPFVNRWGQREDPRRFYVKPDPNAGGMMAIWLRDIDEDGPDFMHQSPQRQRACVRIGLCQVCGRPVPWGSDRCLVVARGTVEAIEIDGGHFAAVTEPWLHLKCAEFAVNVCPALIRRGREEDLRVVSGLTVANTKLAISTGWVDGRLEKFTRQNPVAMFSKIMVPEGIVLAS